jgi:hypothetical protein
MKPIHPNHRADARRARPKAWTALAASLILPAALLATGCQSDYAGQTLPSPWYLTDDVQYYAPGPGFKLAREAAAMQEQKAADVSQPQAGP